MLNKSDISAISVKLLDIAKKQGADQADALVVSSTSISSKRRMRAFEGIERAEALSLGLRVWRGSKQAIVSSTEYSDDALSQLAERAVAMADVSTEDSSVMLANSALLASDITDLQLLDATEPSPAWFHEVCEAMEETALSTKGISNSEGAEAEYQQNHIALATAPHTGEGFTGSYSTSYVGCSISVLAGSGTAMERDYDYATKRFISDLPDPATIGKEAARRTLRRLNPGKLPTTQMPVVFDPRVGKSLLGCLASAINGSAIVRGTSFLKEAMDTQLFPESITITDDPLRIKGLASKPFDAEGVATRTANIVENGILTQWLLDTRSAHKLGLTSTGNASRGTGSSPHPSSSNLYMQPGTLTPEALISDIKDGVYITDVFGMGVNLITGDYSQGAAGLRIENGQITTAVSEFTIAGHLRDMFKHITPANDLTFHYGTNVPTLRLDHMTIAGE